jgi:hypothetical protein
LEILEGALTPGYASIAIDIVKHSKARGFGD